MMLRNRKRFAFLNVPLCVLAALLAFGIAGCSGGDDNGNGGDTRISGRLENGDLRLNSGEYADYYEFSAFDDGTAQIDMESGSIDTYLIVFRQDGSALTRIAEDDDTGDDTDARVRFPVDDGEDYLVVATSAEVGETGTYTLEFSDELGDIFESRARAANTGATTAKQLTGSKK